MIQRDKFNTIPASSRFNFTKKDSLVDKVGEVKNQGLKQNNLLRLDRQDSRSWKNLLAISNLSVRAFNVLLNNFSSIDAFLSYDHSNLDALKNCGKKTISEINDFLAYLKKSGFFQNSALPATNYPISLKDNLSQAPNRQSIQLLPVFNAKISEEVAVRDLHPDFKANVLLENIAFSVRAMKIFDRMGIKTIGEVMCIPSRTFLKQKNFGRKCLKEIQRAILDIVFGDLMDEFRPTEVTLSHLSIDHTSDESLANQKRCGNISKGGAVDFSSYENMVYSFVKLAITSDRDRQILFDRFCFQTSKIPTLKELGGKHQLTRERIRQIIKKGSKVLKIKSNFNKLLFFSDTVRKKIQAGGGVIHLNALVTILQKEFNWPTMPNPLAVGQFLLICLPDQKIKNSTDLVQLPARCLSCCQRPLYFLKNLDFETIESYHISVAGQKLFEHCTKVCDVNPLPVSMFHDAFIETMVSTTKRQFMIQDHLLYSYDQWSVKYGNKLEDAVYQVLKMHAKPMHYSEIAREVRKKSSVFDDMTDHNIHASLSHYSSLSLIKHGTFALKEWNLPPYQTASDAITDLLKSTPIPMRRAEIISLLKNKFSEGNIIAALASRNARIAAIGNGFYDIRERWKQRSCQDFINRLPEGLQAFMSYLVTHNNCSYKCVAALIFVRGMGADGTLMLGKLRERFYEFYAARHANGLTVEREGLLACKIDMLSPLEFQCRCLIKPIKSFLNSGFFLKIGPVLKLREDLIPHSLNPQFRDIMIMGLLKSIEGYFSAFSPTSEVAYPVPPPSDSDRVKETRASDFGADARDAATAEMEISIKKIKRMKIKL